MNVDSVGEVTTSEMTNSPSTRAYELSVDEIAILIERRVLRALESSPPYDSRLDLPLENIAVLDVQLAQRVKERLTRLQQEDEAIDEYLVTLRYFLSDDYLRDYLNDQAATFDPIIRTWSQAEGRGVGDDERMTTELREEFLKARRIHLALEEANDGRHPFDVMRAVLDLMPALGGQDE